MTEEAHSPEAHAEGATLKMYLMVFGGLALLTALTFSVYLIFGQESMTGVWLMMIISVCKATLVATFFMHLIFDWPKIYILIVPALVLGPMLMVVLLPDIVLGWQNVPPPPLP